MRQYDVPRSVPVYRLPVSGACRYAKVNDRDYGRARLLSWYTDANGYPCARFAKSLGGHGRKVRLHLFVLGRKKGYVVDHLDGDKRNCMRDNLRHVPQRGNATNLSAQRKSSSGIRGVHVVPKGWQVQLTLDHKAVSLGIYTDLGRARAISGVAIGLIYGRGTRLLDGTPFDESQVDKLAAEAANIAPADLWQVLARTAGLGDALSAQLRAQLVQPLLAPAQ